MGIRWQIFSLHQPFRNQLPSGEYIQSPLEIYIGNGETYRA